MRRLVEEIRDTANLLTEELRSRTLHGIDSGATKRLLKKKQTAYKTWFGFRPAWAIGMRRSGGIADIVPGHPAAEPNAAVASTGPGGSKHSPPNKTGAYDSTGVAGSAREFCCDRSISPAYARKPAESKPESGLRLSRLKRPNRQSLLNQKLLPLSPLRRDLSSVWECLYCRCYYRQARGVLQGAKVTVKNITTKDTYVVATNNAGHTVYRGFQSGRMKSPPK